MKKRILSLMLAAVLLLTFLPVSALAADTPFTDVPADSYFAEAVSWAAENEITQGVSATEFGALKSCDRATVLTFLWRAAGRPEPTATTCPYTDVELDSWYGKAVLWAVEKGITNGISADKFGTQQPCNRATALTFLWRAAGRPEPTATTCPYTDVELDSWYGRAVLWAVEKGITQGISADKFGTLQTCNRAAVVTFLYRNEMSTPTPDPDPEAPKSLANKVYGEDYTDLYGHCGYYTTIDQVVEDPETGMAMLMVDGELRYLGMDFLSMAMVYNTSVPAGGKWQTEDDVYATWWRYFMTRYNYLMLEIPLYSNDYYTLYNTQITGVQENPTNPYWSAPNALIDWGSTKADQSIILGTYNVIGGAFRYANFNRDTADQEVQSMITGLETFTTTTKDGKLLWNDMVVKNHKTVTNSDGSQTITIQLHDDLKFSDGSKITAKNYLVKPLVFSTPVANQDGSRSSIEWDAFSGLSEFEKYDGQSGIKTFSGLRLIDETTFSITLDPDYASYYYSNQYASLTPDPLALWLGNADIRDDGNGAYLTDDFYAKDGNRYVMADHLYASAYDATDTYPCSGPYAIQSFDAENQLVVLVKNPYFKGNYQGKTPDIQKVIYRKFDPADWYNPLLNGELDILSGITGPDDIHSTIELVNWYDGQLNYIKYSRAGYGMLAFRADLGPTQFTEVRQAIAYCIDRPAFNNDFTGGYGIVVDGAYYPGFWAYQQSLKEGMKLNSYTASLDKAIQVLEEGGWVYNAEGGPYTSGIRYKKIPISDMYPQDINYKSLDGTYTVTQVGDYYYMPLSINWYGTQPNDVTDMLITAWQANENATTAIGAHITYTPCDFTTGLYGEYLQWEEYGWDGVAKCCAINYATGLNSALYDMAWNFTIDPSFYNDYSRCYLKDMADVYWLK